MNILAASSKNKAAKIIEDFQVPENDVKRLREQPETI